VSGRITSGGDSLVNEYGVPWRVLYERTRDIFERLVSAQARALRLWCALDQARHNGADAGTIRKLRKEAREATNRAVL
jgi:hypothetical protein